MVQWHRWVYDARGQFLICTANDNAYGSNQQDKTFVYVSLGIVVFYHIVSTQRRI